MSSHSPCNHRPAYGPLSLADIASPPRTIAIVAMELEAAVSDSVRLRAALEKERSLRAELAQLIAALPTGEVPFLGPLNRGTP